MYCQIAQAPSTLDIILHTFQAWLMCVCRSSLAMRLPANEVGAHVFWLPFWLPFSDPLHMAQPICQKALPTDCWHVQVKVPHPGACVSARLLRRSEQECAKQGRQAELCLHFLMYSLDVIQGAGGTHVFRLPLPLPLPPPRL